MSEANLVLDSLGEEQPGWGVDSKKEARPGVPQETKGAAEENEDDGLAIVMQQESEPAPFVGPNRFLTPVYSTDSPPRGLSGIMRKAAYKLPEYKAQRWMMLLAADRVDVLEHSNVGKVVMGASAFVVAFSIFKMLRTTLRS